MITSSVCNGPEEYPHYKTLTFHSNICILDAHLRGLLQRIQLSRQRYQALFQRLKPHIQHQLHLS